MRNYQRHCGHIEHQDRATKVTPFELVYGQEAVVPVEIGLQSLRVTRRGSLSAKEYHNKNVMEKIISSWITSMEDNFAIGDSK
jgi:hypothetical protein